MDAQGQTLGRLARNIAIALQGKDKTTYSAHVAVGDLVVVTNASALRVTGKKMEQKMYYRHSGRKVSSGPDHPHEAQVTGHPATQAPGPQAIEDGG